MIRILAHSAGSVKKRFSVVPGGGKAPAFAVSYYGGFSVDAVSEPVPLDFKTNSEVPSSQFDLACAGQNKKSTIALPMRPMPLLRNRLFLSRAHVKIVDVRREDYNYETNCCNNNRFGFSVVL